MARDCTLMLFQLALGARGCRFCLDPGLTDRHARWKELGRTHTVIPKISREVRNCGAPPIRNQQLRHLPAKAASSSKSGHGPTFRVATRSGKEGVRILRLQRFW